MPSSPILPSSDSESHSYSSDLDASFLMDPNFSAVLGSPDFNRRLQASENGFGSRSQGAGAMFSSSSVCLLGSLECLSRSLEALWPVTTWRTFIQPLVRPFPGLPS